MANYQDGRIKMWVTMRALNFRREHQELFRSGSYTASTAANENNEHVAVFARFAATRREIASGGQLR